MITTGVTGQTWRATVSPWGSIEPWDGKPLNWYVAAEDRWHVPAEEPAVRQQRIDGTAVAETRIRVPNGDVVQRVFSVADAGGLTIVEVENESTAAVAVAFDRRDVLTDRPIADAPIEGVELPEGAFVAPLAHRAMLRVAVPHDPSRHPSVPGSIPPTVGAALQVVRGWTALTDRPSRFVLPDGPLGAALVDVVRAQRCELALGAIPKADGDPAGFVIALDQLVRMGEQPQPWLPELVDAVERLGPARGWDRDAALAAADRVLLTADEPRARRDLARMIGGHALGALPGEPPSDDRAAAWLESSLATPEGDLMPRGFPAGWLGQPIEVYGLPTAPGSTVSFAIRWHGERPAVLWEQTGDAIELRAPVVAPGWSTTEPSGEALWPKPPAAAPLSSGRGGPDEPRSFS